MPEERKITSSKGNLLSIWLKNRTADLFVTLGAIVAILLATVYLHFIAPASWERHSKVVTFPAGTSFQDIARILEENGIVRDRRSFYLLARLKNAIPKVKAGEYEVDTAMSPQSVLEKLIQGEVIQYPITIPEGYNLYQIAGILHEAKVCDRNMFLEKTKETAFIASLDLEGDSLEGYLFPDTYNFPKGFGEEQVIRQMVSRFKAVYAPLNPRAEQLGLSCKEVVILASMIEKEVVDDQERSLIAAVFHNRLLRGMALQSDPTAVYGAKINRANGQKITRQDLLRKSPYNTYHINGLPKGPISNPGLRSLQAVLYPANVNYLYFVSQNDRSHFFSSTLAEHNRAVSRYRAWVKKNSKPEVEKNPPGSDDFSHLPDSHKSA
jgi:UPF0755 protein